MLRLPISARVLALLLASSVGLVACAAESDDAGEEGVSDESDLTEGSPEARAVLALVNHRETTAEVLTKEGGLTTTTTSAILGHRDGADGALGTDDDDAYDTLAELDAIRGVGAATLQKLVTLARKRGFFASAGASNVLFSPLAYDQSHLARIAREIDAAKSTIDIAMYSYSDAKIGTALANATKRGVRVRFIYDGGGDDHRLDTAAERAASKSSKLELAGVDVRFVNKVMHHKAMIVDGPRDDLAKAKTARLVTGSANWSNSAATKFDENTLFLSSEELALRFQREFELMWAHARDFSAVAPPLAEGSGAATITDAAIPDDPNAAVYFTSSNFTARGTTFSTTGENTVANALVAAITSATKSIHIASGHLRSRPVAEALVAKKKASPALDVRVYLDGQEFISKTTHDEQVTGLETCIANAGASESKARACKDKGFLFGYQIGEAGIDVRYKYYAYRWDHGYAPQMHHKYMVVDGTDLWTGSYNLSDNAEHETFENMIHLRGAENAALVQSFEQNFLAIWETGRADDELTKLQGTIRAQQTIPIVFQPMALRWSEVNDLKRLIRSSCPAVDSVDFRRNAASKTTCTKP